MSTPIHLDLEAARAVLANMNRVWETMDGALTAYLAAADTLRDGVEWVSPSYSEYDYTVTETRNFAKTQVNRLAELKELLAREIAEWEKAGSKLG
ncbi:MAG: hypothetical protein JW929_13880 [Anaerolineales bacterium]|nr:hypothetical protein [Anaerolineales bacterium]